MDGNGCTITIGSERDILTLPNISNRLQLLSLLLSRVIPQNSPGYKINESFNRMAMHLSVILGIVEI